MTMYESQCSSCRHAAIRNGRFVGECSAFPDGISPSLLQNQHDHRHPYPGDQGIRWAPRTPADKHPLDQSQG